MEISDARHRFDCQRCAHTGGLCMEAVWLGRRLMQGLEARRAALPEDFVLVSRARFTGCGRPCEVRLRMTAEVVELDCGGESGGPALARVSVSARAGMTLAAAASA